MIAILIIIILAFILLVLAIMMGITFAPFLRYFIVFVVLYYYTIDISFLGYVFEVNVCALVLGIVATFLLLFLMARIILKNSDKKKEEQLKKENIPDGYFRINFPKEW